MSRLHGKVNEPGDLDVWRSGRVATQRPDIDVELAVAAAQPYRALKAKGRMIRRTNDCWIATFCLLYDSLRVIHP